MRVNVSGNLIKFDVDTIYLLNDPFFICWRMKNSDRSSSYFGVGSILVVLVVILFGIWLLLKGPWGDLNNSGDRTTTRSVKKEDSSERSATDSSSIEDEEGVSDSRSEDLSSAGTIEKQGTSGSTSSEKKEMAEQPSQEGGEDQTVASEESRDSDDQKEPEAAQSGQSDATGEEDGPDPETEKHSETPSSGSTGAGTSGRSTSKKSEPNSRKIEQDPKASPNTAKENGTDEQEMDSDSKTKKEKEKVASKLQAKKEEKANGFSDKLSSELRDKKKKAKRLYQEKRYDRAIKLLTGVQDKATGSKKEEIGKTLSTWRQTYRERRKLAKIWYKKAKQAKEKEAWDQVIEHTKKMLSYLPHSSRGNALLEEAKRREKFEGMTRIEEGRYRVGSTSVEGHPEKQVTLAGFYIDRYEVTNGDYAEFVEDTGHRPPLNWDGNEPPQGQERHPVTGVSFRDAEAYAKWAGKRLPSEREWEAAARGTQGRPYPWGSSQEGVQANTVENGENGTVPVNSMSGGATPNQIFHLLGNVAEWTTTKVKGSGGKTYRVVKGGSFLYPMKKGVIAKRLLRLPKTRVIGIGFRCVLDVPSEDSPKKGDD